jgi:hypothetical protein
MKTRMFAVSTALVGLFLLAGGCGDDDSGQNQNNTAGPDGGGMDAAPGDGGQVDATAGDGGQVDAAVADAAVADASTDGGTASDWVVKASQLGLESTGVLVAAHPTAPNTIAVLREVDEMFPNFEIYLTSNGTVFTPSVVMSFVAPVGFYAYPMGLAFDPNDGDNLVAALEPFPPPTMGEDVIHAWSSTAGSLWDRSTSSFTNPWPADEVRFVGGTSSVVVWRASSYFHLSSSLGAFNDSVEQLSEPTGCGQIYGFDMASDNHDQVVIRCSQGPAFVCVLSTDQCTQIPLAGAPDVRYVTFAPGDPDHIYLLTASDEIFVSTDRGVSTTSVHSFSGHEIRVSPANPQHACALSSNGGDFHCTANGGSTWQVLDPPHLVLPGMTLIRGFTFASDGAIWAVAHPGVIYHAPL